MSIRRFTLLISLLVHFLLPLAASAQEQPQPTFAGQIAYIGSDGNLWVLRSDSQIPIPITYDATTERRYHSPVWSADGSRLAYCVSDEEGSGKGQLYVVWSGEWLPFLVSQDVYCKDSSIPLFDWSLDGLQLYFARAFSPASAGGSSVWDTYAGIWQANIITGAQAELIPPPGDNPLIYPDLSPDGRWMRFYEVIYFEGLGVLRTWQAESSSLANWLGLGANLFPGLSDWSPDGTQVVFDQVTYGGFPGAALFVSAPDGSGLRKVFSNPEAAAVHPLWSPDGQNIAFSAAMFGEPGARLVLIDPNGENLRRVYHGPDSLTPLAWSPDSSQLLFGYREDEQINLALYDISKDAVFPLTTAGDWAVDWAPLPQGAAPAASLPQDALLDFPYADGSLLYISPDYRLVLAHPQTGSQVDLTRPMTMAGFTASPSRRSLVYGNRWLALDFREGGKLSLHTVALPSAPQNGSVNWSPDETHLSLKAQDGAIWLVRQDGNAVRVPNAVSLPEWSYNGSWLSYCASDGGLWLIGASTPPTRIAVTGICQHRWSSGQDLLAYTAQDASAINGLRSYLYNPVTGESTLLSEGMSVESWSPDGNYIALTRPKGDGFSAFAVNPSSGEQLYIGDFDQRGLGLQSWLVSGDGYFYGGYRLAADLSAASKVADILFDASDDGGTLLVGVGAYDLVTMVCLKPAGGEETNLLTVNLATIPPEQKPGIWAQLSSDGEWLSYQVADSAGMRAGLASCDGRSQEQLAAVKIPFLDGFSADGGWFAQSEVDPEGAGQLVLRNLGGGEDRAFPALSSSPAYWIGNLRHGPPETYLISGKVTDAAGQPVAGVTILLDDQPATTTAEDGTYVVAGLKAGKYSLSPQGDAAPFEPERRRVSLPPDALQVDFISQKAVPTATFAASASATPSAQPSTPTPTPLYWPANVQQVPGFLEGWLVANGLPQGSSLLILLICGALLAGLLIVLLILLIVRRRKSTSSVGLPAPEVAFSPVKAGGVNLDQAPPADTQPTRIASQPSAALQVASAPFQGAKPLPTAKQADTQPVHPEASDAQLYQLLKQGITHVKSNNFAEGMRELRRVVQAQPNNANAWLWLGWSAARQGDRRTAYNCFKRAQALGHPKAEEGLRWIGSK